MSLMWPKVRAEPKHFSENQLLSLAGVLTLNRMMRTSSVEGKKKIIDLHVSNRVVTLFENRNSVISSLSSDG